jgi:hypothetical protein
MVQRFKGSKVQGSRLKILLNWFYLFHWLNWLAKAERIERIEQIKPIKPIKQLELGHP